MIVALGEKVEGNNGTLGEIEGFRIDPNSQSADQMVIKRGLPFGSGHLAVLGHVTGVESGVVRVNLSKQDLEALEQYSQGAYHSSELGPGVVPPFDAQGDNRYKHPGNVPFASPNPTTAPEQSSERFNETHTMPPTYPTESSVAPNDKQPIVITKGMDVWDNAGIKVGQVRSFAVETSTGQPTEIAVEHGLFGHDGCDLKLGWVEGYGSKGIVLNVSKDQIETCK